MSNGSVLDPFHDLSEVFQGTRVQPGQTIYLRGGTYTSVPELAISGGAGQPIVIRPYETEEVIFQPSSGDRALYIAGQAYLDIRNIIFDGTNVAIDTAKVTSNAHHITFTDCTFQKAPQQGMLITGAATTAIDFTNCIFRNNGHSEFDHGIYIDIGGSCSLVGCTLHDNFSHGIHVYGGADTSTWLIDHCVSYNHQIGIGLYCGSGLCHDCAVHDNGIDMTLRYNLSGAECYANVVGWIYIGPITINPSAIDIHDNLFTKTELTVPTRLPDDATIGVHENAVGELLINGDDLYNVTLENNS